MRVKDEFLCPRCGKRTIFPVNETNGDFIAVHSVQYGVIEGGVCVPMEHIMSHCTSNETKTNPYITPCEKAIYDLPKSSFDKNGKLIATKSAQGQLKKTTLAIADCLDF